MHVERVEFDGFRPMDQCGEAAGDVALDGPAPGTVSLIARDGQIRISFATSPKLPRRALIDAIRQLLRMSEYRGGAQRLTFARTLSLRGLERRPSPHRPSEADR
ncbi:hypothetical protein [Salipiger mangrovisoli]|uniref:YbaB/EbfC DNA-binding family protein n=1 Tax=Salipiger mangrovisoli TaxID=2865933 RepID=A0ABR9X2I4_9RHOB|nr:hypothetical protein [Salipiger mangrovisoli]MBE9637767.1 hypothetical protein [Salipiger mangrovisoli]